MTILYTSPKKDFADEELSPREIVRRVTELAPVLKARAAETERDRRVSPDAIEMLRDAGVFRILQPRCFGGLEYGFLTLAETALSLASACGSTAWCACLSSAHAWIVALYPLEAQQEIWADPNAILASSNMPVGKCVRRPGGYAISGSWSFASNADNCQWFIVAAMLPPEGSRTEPVPAWFLVPASAARVRDTWFSAGLGGTGSNTIVIDDETFVPEHRVLTVPQINSGEAPGAAVHGNPLYRLSFTGTMPFALSSLPLGMAIGAVSDFIGIASTKTVAQAGGPPVPMKSIPSVQVAIGDASSAVEAARALLIGDLIELEGNLAKGVLPDIPTRVRNRRNHAYTARQAAHAVTTLFEATGANGADLSNPIQRAWRDVNVAARHISLNWPGVSAMYAQQQLGLPVIGTF